MKFVSRSEPEGIKEIVTFVDGEKTTEVHQKSIITYRCPSCNETYKHTEYRKVINGEEKGWSWYISEPNTIYGRFHQPNPPYHNATKCNKEKIVREIRRDSNVTTIEEVCKTCKYSRDVGDCDCDMGCWKDELQCIRPVEYDGGRYVFYFEVEANEVCDYYE
ncbi:MAG: hypothetical protein GTN80_06810 [Nitrososphaeria archaeon]|nr:hypothetical protein [Nitrososphaeria archaeon]